MPAFAQLVNEVFTSPTPQRLDESLQSGGEIRYELLLSFAVPMPAGYVAGEVIWIDRAFRYAARAAEEGEPLAALMARRGRGIPIAEGLRLEAIEEGSVRSVLLPSARIARQRLSVAASAMTILTGAIVVTDRIDDHVGSHPVSPANEPYVAPQLPTEVDITIVVTRRKETTKVVFRREGQYYVTLEPPLPTPSLPESP